MAEHSEVAQKAQATERPIAQIAVSRPRDLDWSRVPRLALWGGAAAVLIAAMGLVEAFGERQIVQGMLTMGYVLLFGVPLATGYVAGQPPPQLEGMAPPRRGIQNPLAGLVAGLGSAVLLSLFVVIASSINLRPVLVNVSPRLVELLTFGKELGPGLILLVGGCGLAGLLGGALHLVPARWRMPALQALFSVIIVGLLRDLSFRVFQGVKLAALGEFLFDRKGLSPLGGAVTLAATYALYISLGKKDVLLSRVDRLPASQQRTLRFGAMALFVVILAIVPQVVGNFFSEVLTIVGLYLLMGLGLNIVVGLAGLLDLGYVAFFAVGAYTAAVLTSPSSPQWNPELVFWAALPFVVLAAASAGLMVGTPVLRMRGDYLAIVTLGFGEIARLVFQSDWFRPIFGGAQGIINIPSLTIGSVKFVRPAEIYYPILGFCLLAAYISWRLADSRIGRAWIAMREDEQVAEAMGINIVTTKLSAFIIGAILASFGGALFAVKIGSIFPSSFSIYVSITVLVVIIVGGMGNIPGVVVGTLAVVALPELLREFQEYRLLFYGALLIGMMLLKPEGLMPSVRRARELHEEEMAQDVWLKAEGEAETKATTEAAATPTAVQAEGGKRGTVGN